MHPDASETRRPPRSAVLVGVAALGVYALTHLLLLRRFPWFIDENLYADWAQTVLADPAQRFIALSDHKGLINSWIAAAFIKAGLTPMDAMRLISILSVPVVAAAAGAVVTRWRGWWQGTATFAGCLLIPFLFVHGAIGVHDPFVAAGSMVSLWLGIELARRPRLDLALLIGITWGLLLLAKQTGSLAIILMPASLLVFDWHAARLRQRLLAWAALLGLALIIAVAMWAITRLSPLAYGPPATNHRTLSDLVHDPFGTFGKVAWPSVRGMIGYLSIPGTLLLLWGMTRAFRERDRTGAILTIWVVASFVAMLLLTNNGYPRYGLQIAAPAVALMVFGAETLVGSPRGRLVLVIAAMPALLLDLWVVAAPQRAPYPGLDHDQYVKLASNREPTRRAAERIVRLANADRTAPTTIYHNLWPSTISLAVNGRTKPATPRFQITVGESPTPEQIDATRYIVWDGTPPSWFAQHGARVVGRWGRGGQGPTTYLLIRDAR